MNVAINVWYNLGMIWNIFRTHKNLDDLKRLSSFGINSDLYKCYPKAARYYFVFLYSKLLNVLDKLYSDQSPEGKLFLNIPEEMDDIYCDLHDAFVSVHLRKDMPEYHEIISLPIKLHDDQAGLCSLWHDLKEPYYEQLADFVKPFHEDIETRYYPLPLDIEAHLARMEELLAECLEGSKSKIKTPYNWSKNVFECMDKKLEFKLGSHSHLVFSVLLLNKNHPVRVKSLSERVGIPPRDVRRIINDLKERLKDKQLLVYITITSSHEGSYTLNIA